ncbi:hypothetical protein PIB30_095343 [Stylosanthes scabra]|uniref:Leucine-rich repeat-containing N-terminal plant-type domain-containing protein n=1 Tax=Stylosanthes scabra TaxID=79078 RepID=A0ABU6UV64_9FABA|nr:hypothetical protein [Stylosanthes scabra]
MKLLAICWPLPIVGSLMTTASVAIQGKEEAYALLKWKASFEKKSQVLLSSWNSSDPCSHWVGIACEDSKSVSFLNFTNFGIRGIFQTLNFSSLPNIRAIVLNNNSFYGTIPKQIRVLSNLDTLDAALVLPRWQSYFFLSKLTRRRRGRHPLGGVKVSGASPLQKRYNTRTSQEAPILVLLSPKHAYLRSSDGIRYISAGMIAPANVCAHNYHKRVAAGNSAAAERPCGAHLLVVEPALPDARPAGAELSRRGLAAGRTGKKEVLKKSAGMIAPANVCAHNYHKRAAAGNGASAERPCAAHLLAMEPRPSGFLTSRSRASGTRVGGQEDG